MNESIKCFKKAGYLFIKVTGSWTIETAKEVIEKSKNEATARGYNRILLDLREWLKPTDEIVRFLSGQYLAKTLRSPFKIAAYAAPKAINKFGENTAVNRGAYFRIFPDEDSAIIWLLEKGN